MCPDPALLAAYVDGTLFSRDAIAVDEHMSTCARCTALLAALRDEREAAQASRWPRSRTIGLVIAGVIILAIGTWAVLLGAKRESDRGVTPARSETGRSTASSTSAATANAPTTIKESDAARLPSVPTEKAPKPSGMVKATRPSGKPSPDSVRRSDASPDKSEAARPAVSETTRADVTENPAQPESGVTLRGRGRNANRRVLWRTRDLVIEHSTDAGTTWVAEHTADRPIRAGAFVDTNVAWLVGENGLILRRTKNGWFAASAPADGNINAVRASSPSKATVTLEDGRIFRTEDGGVTWSAP